MIAPTDCLLLTAVQHDATMTAQDMGGALNLSPGQAAQRPQRPEGEGFITGYGAQLAPDRIGLTLQAFLHIELADHSQDSLQAYRTLISACPWVISAWTLTGEADYLLPVWCADLAALNRLIHHVMLPHPAIARVQSQIVMDHLKADAAPPI